MNDLRPVVKFLMYQVREEQHARDLCIKRALRILREGSSFDAHQSEDVYPVEQPTEEEVDIRIEEIKNLLTDPPKMW